MSIRIHGEDDRIYDESGKVLRGNHADHALARRSAIATKPIVVAPRRTTVCDQKPRRIMVDGVPSLEYITVWYGGDFGDQNGTDVLGLRTKFEDGQVWTVVAGTTFTVTYRRALLPSELRWHERWRLFWQCAV